MAKKSWSRRCLLALLALTGCWHQANLDDLLAPGAVPEKLAGGFAFTEGPDADAEGNVYFTDQPNNRILQWGVDGRLSVFLEPSGRSNGMEFDSGGRLWACADERNELWRIGPAKEIKVLVSTYRGKPLNGPNDLWISPTGGVYLTDPFYPRPWWNHTAMPQECQGVYFFNPADGSLIRVAGDLVQPNGIVGTPDGHRLYVADIGAGKTWRYRIGKDNALYDKSLFCEMGSDGMTIDRKGNLYLTGPGVTVFDPRGRKLGHIDIPEPWTANVCFGGPGHRDLFITASGSLYRLKTNTRGAR